MSGIRLVLVVLSALVLLGCQTTPEAAGTAAYVVAPGQYTATFDAARRVLRDRGFILERVDAQAGVITTQPKTTAGLATPWDMEQQSIAQETEDLLERQQRVVRITFGESAPDAPDLRVATDPLAMRVQVTIQRVQIPGHKLETEAINQSTYYYDPALGARLMQPQYAVAYKQDPEAAARLAELIEAAVTAPASK